MSKKIILFVFALLVAVGVQAQEVNSRDTADYLSGLKEELTKAFPKNRTINLVFHGHSVPSGYWTNHEVHTLESYPNLLLVKLKKKYPYAVINIILTSIGGEHSEKGQTRFSTDVLPHKPDVIFIDYALNDMGMGLERANTAWSKMIEEALAHNIKVVLVTPSPDQRQNFADKKNVLALHAEQISKLAAKYGLGLVDPFAVFQKIEIDEGSVKHLMSGVNHPNQPGHNIIAEEIFKLF